MQGLTALWAGFYNEPSHAKVADYARAFVPHTVSARKTDLRGKSGLFIVRARLSEQDRFGKKST